jgi:hypothetical protein
LVEFVHNFIAILISVPGHPEFGPFYLLRGLQKVIQEYPWPEGTSSKADIYNSMIAMLSASSQRSLPYHFPKVEANDILYGGTQEFEQETNEYINELIALIMEEIKVLKKKHLETGVRSSPVFTFRFPQHTILSANYHADEDEESKGFHRFDEPYFDHSKAKQASC